MTFWHYIVIGCIIQAIITAERTIRMPWIWKDLIESFQYLVTWIVFPLALMCNVIVWPLSIYCEIRNIQLDQ